MTIPVTQRRTPTIYTTKPSPSSASHEQGGLNAKERVTVSCIMDCPTIAVHTGKCYKALIDSGVAISLLR